MRDDKAVNVYRLVTKDTVEEDILNRAKVKLTMSHVIVEGMDTSGVGVVAAAAGGGDGGAASSKSSSMFNSQELAKIVQFGAADMFASAAEAQGEEGEKEHDEKVL